MGKIRDKREKMLKTEGEIFFFRLISSIIGCIRSNKTTESFIMLELFYLKHSILLSKLFNRFYLEKVAY